MRKADARGSGATSATTQPSAAAPPPARTVALAHGATTIGRYIARFRYEQPLPREQRVGVQKEDFWWKSGDSSSPTAHRRSRLRQQQQSVHEHSGASSLSASSASASSGYERYIPELRHEHHASDHEGVDTPTLRGQSPVVAANSTLDSGAALLLSSLSASWDSVPSHLEAPSSSASHESPFHERRWELPPSHDVTTTGETRRPYGSPYGAAMARTAGATPDEHKVEEDEAKVEDAELVIERVRKRLGWSSSDSGNSDHSHTFQYDASSPSPHRMQWRRPHGPNDSTFEAAAASSRARVNGGDDEILSGTMRRASGEPQYDKSLELALSELNSSDVPRRSHDLSCFGVSRSLEALDAATFYSAPRDEGFTAEERMATQALDELARDSPRVISSVEVEVAESKTQVPDLKSSDADEDKVGQRDEDGVTQMELLVSPPNAHHDATGEVTGTKPIDAATRTTGATARNKNADEDGVISNPTAEQAKEAHDDAEATPALLQSVESPVLPPWRRSSRSLSSALSPRADASSFSTLRASRPSPLPSPTSLSSQSSVTAETAKTLDGLVSLVVQSWSSDFVFDAAEDDDPKDSLPGDALKRKTSAGTGEEEDEVKDDWSTAREELESVPSLNTSDHRVDIPAQGDVAPDTSSPMMLSPVEPERLLTTKAVEEVSSADPASLEKDTEQLQDEAAMDENEDDEDEIVQLLRARIALYEQALRHLDHETERA